MTGSIATQWTTTEPLSAAAIDAGTRELDVTSARAAMERIAPWLAAGSLAFKKIDSLLRGHIAAELAVCMRYFDHCVLAPAFPFQGRITQDGRQLVRDGDAWRDTGIDLGTALCAEGLAICVWDARTDADLDAIVTQGRKLPGRVLWCGTGGLAGALAGRRPVPRPRLPRPILALIGSNHPVSAAQVAAAPVELRAAIVTCDLPRDIDRHEARSRISETFSTLLQRVERPGTLLIIGGETLRDVCAALGASHLEVDGEIEPGAPTSRLRGGRWNGQRIVSKSGAFGDTDFLTQLLRDGELT